MDPAQREQILHRTKDDKDFSLLEDVFSSARATIDTKVFRDQYEMQEMLDALPDDKNIEILVTKSRGTVITGKYSSVMTAIEQLMKLIHKETNESVTQTDNEPPAKITTAPVGSNSLGQEKLKPTGLHRSDSTEQERLNSRGLDRSNSREKEISKSSELNIHLNQKDHQERKRNLIRNTTPGFNDDSALKKQSIPIDEHVCHYIMSKHVDRVASISTNNRCATRVVPGFSEDRVTYNLEVTTSSSYKNVENAVEEFAQLYQEVTAAGIDEEIVKLPAEWRSKEEVAKLTKDLSSRGFLLMYDNVYRLIGPRSDWVKAKEKVSDALTKHYSRLALNDLKDESHSMYCEPKDERGPLRFQTPGGIEVSVSQGDLVHQKVDAIVNPANSSLRHGSGAARAIAEAAGYDLNRECKEFIYKNGELRTTYVMSTTAGRLSPQIKRVIHAVGPQRSHYPDDRTLYQKVKETVLNCLHYANDRLKINSIAIPAISSGIYGVPLDIVARASFEALVDFDKVSTGRFLHKICFLNIDENTFLGMRKIFSSLQTKRFGSSVDREHSEDGSELLDRYAAAFDRKRIRTSPDNHCFSRAMTTALQQDLHFNSSYQDVEDRIKKELEKNRKEYSMFRLVQPEKSWMEWIKSLPSVISGSDSGQKDTFDIYFSAAANAFDAEIVLVQPVENQDPNEIKFMPRSKKTERQVVIANYYNGHHHFDALIKDTKSTVTKLSCDSKVDCTTRQNKNQHSKGPSNYSSRSSAQSPGPLSLENGFGKLGELDDVEMQPDDERSGGKSGKATGGKPKEDEDDDCIICMDKIVDKKELQCKHKFCRECIDTYFQKGQPKCPSCGKVFGVLRGDQPKGSMTYSEDKLTRLGGYLDCGAIVITYHFPDGTQGPNHPNPGQRYRGTYRTAYLPANKEGREVLKLLKQAFDAGLVFTIGRSNTTGHENVVIWNDVHHKTNIVGQYGYPDPTYLKRVREELAAKGIQ